MRKVELKELCKPDQIGKYGIPASAEVFSVNKTRYLRITDIDDQGNLLDNDRKSVTAEEISKYILVEGDIVFARTGNSTGRAYFHESKNGELAFAGFLIKYGLDPGKVNPKYLKYFTVSEEYRQWVKNLSVGSTRGNINAQTFADCPIILPDREQQNLLVSVLSALDDKIELNNRINAELEQMARTLYDYWFVQFDFPNSKGKPYKSSGGKMVYNEVLKREIPEGWEVKTLGDSCSINSCQINKDTAWEFYNYLDTSNLTKNVVGTVVKYNNQTDLPSRAKRIVAKDDIIYSTVRPNQEHYGILKCLQPNMIVSTGFTVLSPNLSERINDIIYYYLSAKETIDYLQSIAQNSVSAYPSINPDDLAYLRIALPKSFNLIKPISSCLSSLNMKIHLNQQESKQLASLRDWLLPMLMNGQVKVAEKSDAAMSMAAEPMSDYGNG